MVRHLPILFLLSVICYLLSVIPLFAQEITITPVVTNQPSTYAQSLDQFVSKLLILDIPKKLNDGFQQAVPLEVGSLINNEEDSVKSSEDKLGDTVRGYSLFSSRQTNEVTYPKKEDFFSQVFRNIIALIPFGNEKAEETIESQLPLGIGKKVLNSDTDNISPNSENGMPPSESMTKSLPALRCAGISLEVGNCASSFAF